MTTANVLVPVEKMNTNSENVLDNLFLHGTMFDLTIRVWQARKNAQTFFEDLGISGQAWQDHLLVGTQVKFIDDEIRKSFREHELRARSWLNRNSLPFVNLRFVPYSALQTLLSGDTENEKDGLIALKNSFDASVKAFLDDFDNIRQKYIDAMSTKKEEYRAILEKVYPQKDDVADKFFFGWQMFDIRVPNSADSAATETNVDDVLAHQKALAQTVQQLQQQSLSFVEDSVGILRNNIVDALGQFNKVLTSNGSVKTSSISAVKKAIQNFRELNFANDKSLEQILKDFETKLGETRTIPKDQGDVKTALSQCVTNVINQTRGLNNIDSITGQLLRKID